MKVNMIIEVKGAAYSVEKQSEKRYRRKLEVIFFIAGENTPLDPRQFSLDPRHSTLDPRPSTKTYTRDQEIFAFGVVAYGRFN